MSPFTMCNIILKYVSGSPSPYIADTVPTTIASLRSVKDFVADNLICSICSFKDASFSIKVSDTGTYASG